MRNLEPLCAEPHSEKFNEDNLACSVHGYSLSFSFLFHLFILNFFSKDAARKTLVSATDNAPQGSAAEWRGHISSVQFQVSKALAIYFVLNNSWKIYFLS